MKRTVAKGFITAALLAMAIIVAGVSAQDNNDNSVSGQSYIPISCATVTARWRLTPLESDRFEIRFDYFNALNTPQFAPGTGDVTDTTFNDFRFNTGNLLIGNVNGGRIGQLQLRYVF